MMGPEIKKALIEHPALVIYPLLEELLKESKRQTEFLQKIYADIPSLHDR